MNLMKRNIKTKAGILLLVVFYFLFPTSVFYGGYNKLFENSNSGASFKVVVYKLGVCNLYSFYKFIKNEEYFFVVYDRCNNVVFKPSLWFGVSQSVVYGGFHFSKHNRNELFFPTNDGVYSTELAQIPDCSS